jgi:hypothetical protein
MDTAGLTFNQQKDVFEKYYYELVKDLKKEFSEIDTTNMNVFSALTGYIWILIYLDNNKFDFSRLDKFKFDYAIKPALRSRQYHVTILEEQ